MALGYHSLAQVTVGSLLGVLLHFYQTRAPQGMILVDAFVQIVLGCITLNVDPALVYSDNDQNNLFSWFVRHPDVLPVCLPACLSACLCECGLCCHHACVCVAVLTALNPMIRQCTPSSVPNHPGLGHRV